MYRTNGFCMCGGVLGSWNEIPYTWQKVMHSPVGCLRREMNTWELKALYKQLTGYEIGSDDLSVVFQVVMVQLSNNRDIANTLPVVLDPVTQHAPRYESSPNLKRKVRYQSSVPPGIKTPNGKGFVVVNPGPIKPPWEK